MAELPATERRSTSAGRCPLWPGGGQRHPRRRAHHRPARAPALSRAAGALRSRRHLAVRGRGAHRLARRTGSRIARLPPRRGRRGLLHHASAVLDHPGLRFPPAHRRLRAVGPARRLVERPSPPHGGCAPAVPRRAGGQGRGENRRPDAHQRAAARGDRRARTRRRNAPRAGRAPRSDARHRLRSRRPRRHHLLEPRCGRSLRVDEGGGRRHRGAHPHADGLPRPARRDHGRADSHGTLGG